MSVRFENGKWYYRFRLYGKRPHGVCYGCNTYEEAKEFEADLITKMSLIHRGKIPDDQIITIKEMFNISMRISEANNAEKTHKDNLHKVEVLSEFFGAKNSISEITPSKIEEFKTYLIKTKKRSKATFNRYYACLSKAFNDVIIDKKLNIQNPCRSVKKLKEDNQITRYLTKEEEERLMSEIPAYMKPIIVCALSTGLRLSNVLNLKWESIDFDANFIEILRQLNKGHKKIQLPISKKLKLILEEIGIKKTGFVFISYRTNTRFKKIDNGFNEACKRANIENFRFHDLRHTVATRLVANGADLGTVKEYMGHSTLAMTQRYSHPTPENMLKAVDILDSF